MQSCKNRVRALNSELSFFTKGSRHLTRYAPWDLANSQFRGQGFFIIKFFFLKLPPRSGNNITKPENKGKIVYYTTFDVWISLLVWQRCCSYRDFWWTSKWWLFWDLRTLLAHQKYTVVHILLDYQKGWKIVVLTLCAVDMDMYWMIKVRNFWNFSWLPFVVLVSFGRLDVRLGFKKKSFWTPVFSIDNWLRYLLEPPFCNEPLYQFEQYKIFLWNWRTYLFYFL